MPVCWSAVASEQSFREISFGGACVALGDQRAVRGGTRLATPFQQEGCGCEQNLVESVLCLVLPNEQRVVGQNNPSRSPSFPELQERIGLLRAGMDPHQGITQATSSPSHQWSESLRLTGQNDHVPRADSAAYMLSWVRIYVAAVARAGFIPSAGCPAGKLGAHANCRSQSTGEACPCSGCFESCLAFHSLTHRQQLDQDCRWKTAAWQMQASLRLVPRHLGTPLPPPPLSPREAPLS